MRQRAGPARQLVGEVRLRELGKEAGGPVEDDVDRARRRARWRRARGVRHLAQACVAVSGSVSLELLYRRVPSTIVYRVGKLGLKVAGIFKKSRYICLVNLLAGKELYPEFLTDCCAARPIAGHLERWLADPAARAALRAELGELCDQVAEPGACGRVADYVLTTLAAGQGRRRAA